MEAQNSEKSTGVSPLTALMKSRSNWIISNIANI